MLMTLSVAEPDVFGLVAVLLGKNVTGRGTVLLEVDLGDGDRARVVLGRAFLIDSELCETIRQTPGVIDARLSVDNGSVDEQRSQLAFIS